MKAIHYDAEGDILSVTFDSVTAQPQTGVELTDNLVLYLNPDTGEAIKLIVISYQAMLSAPGAITLDGLASVPAILRTAIENALKRAPLNAFIQLAETSEMGVPTGRVQAVFMPDAVQVVTAS